MNFEKLEKLHAKKMMLLLWEWQFAEMDHFWQSYKFQSSKLSETKDTEASKIEESKRAMLCFNVKKMRKDDFGRLFSVGKTRALYKNNHQRVSCCCGGKCYCRRWLWKSRWWVTIISKTKLTSVSNLFACVSSKFWMSAFAFFWFVAHEKKGLRWRTHIIKKGNDFNFFIVQLTRQKRGTIWFPYAISATSQTQNTVMCFVIFLLSL